MAELLPVLSYATGAGWAELGRARSPEQARNIVLAHLGDASKSLVKNYGFQVYVDRRTPLQRELNGGPDGYIWSVGKTIPRH